jgi:hypothetical protein
MREPIAQAWKYVKMYKVPFYLVDFVLEGAAEPHLRCFITNEAGCKVKVPLHMVNVIYNAQCTEFTVKPAAGETKNWAPRLPLCINCRLAHAAADRSCPI